MSAVINDETERKSVRSHFVHTVNFSENIRQKIGIIEGELYFGRFYLGISPFISMLDEFEEGLKRGRLNTEKKLNEKVLKEIRQIWYGEIFMVVVRDPYDEGTVLRRDICYDKNILLKQNEKLIKLPSLRNLNPTDPIKDEKMLLRIREPVDLQLAFDRQDYRQIVIEGKMIYNYKGKKEPQFEGEEEFRNSQAQVMSVSRQFFFACIGFLHFWFQRKMAIVLNEIDEILIDDFKNQNKNVNEDEYHMKSFTNELD